MIKGSIRLVAALILCVIVFPYVLGLFLALSPDASAQDYLMVFLDSVPFGDSIVGLAASVLQAAQSGADAFLDLLVDSSKNLTLRFSMDLAEMIFTSVIIFLLGHVLGKVVFQSTGKDIFNQAANVLFEIFLIFCASLIVEGIFDFFSDALMKIPDITQEIMGYIYSAGLGVTSIIILVIAGMFLLDACIRVIGGCVNIFVSYAMFAAILLNKASGGPRSITILCIVI